MLNFQAVDEVCSVEKSNEQHMLNPNSGKQWINPSKRLVDHAINKWHSQSLRPDNTSVVTVMLDPPGPPRAQVLKRQRETLASSGSMALVTNQEEPALAQPLPPSPKQPSGLSIISRFPNAANLRERNLAESGPSSSHNRVLHDFQPRGTVKELNRPTSSCKLVGQADSSTLNNCNEASTSHSTVRLPSDNENIQCNEVSSSTPNKKLKSSSTALTPKLSRELSALQIQGTTSKRGRTRSASDSNSDTENEAPKSQQNSAKNLELAEQEQSTMLKHNPHFLRSKEAKVKKATSLAVHSNAQGSNSPTTVMSLRPRPASTLDSPSRKRKQGDLESANTKSPRMMSVVNTKPVMTRSRTARVLMLKK